MSGLRTIAALLVGFLVLFALGASMASCVDRAEPRRPNPLEPRETPMTIASTRCFEGLSDDARYAALDECRANGARVVFDMPTYVLCDRGQQTWFTRAVEMPENTRGIR